MLAIMRDARQRLAVARADEARHGQCGVGLGNMLKGCGLALQDGITLGRMAHLERGAHAARAQDPVILVAFALEWRPHAGKTIAPLGEGLKRIKRQGGRSQRVEHGAPDVQTKRGGPLRWPPLTTRGCASRFRRVA